MKGSNFAFDGVNYLYYDLNKISISKGESYIDSPKCLKNKKSTINLKNNDYKCFQYAITLALNLDRINNHPERTSKIKPFLEEYNWKDIDFPSTSKDWKKFELNNEIALNILYVPHNTKKIEIAYKSKHNLTREKQIILLMISNGENWHYLVVKSLSCSNKLVSEPNYHKMKLISENLSIIEMKKVKVKMKKPIYLGLSILEISKIIMYEFWYDYIKSIWRYGKVMLYGYWQSYYIY